MVTFEKSSQLQIRVSPLEKKMLRQRAFRAGIGMSEYVLMCLFPPQKEAFLKLLHQLQVAKTIPYLLAEIHDWLQNLNPTEFETVFHQEISLFSLSLYLQNYLAAMIEEAALKKNASVPTWLKNIEPLTDPFFGSDLKSLRLHLLKNSPVPFRKRNIFIDSTLGDRV
jgi:hypothetical protein